MSWDYDAIVVLSGDGLIHEVFNGLADRENTTLALEMPVVQIPTGSANGFSMALLGVQVSNVGPSFRTSNSIIW